MKELIIASYGATSLFQIVWEWEVKEYRINKIKKYILKFMNSPLSPTYILSCLTRIPNNGIF